MDWLVDVLGSPLAAKVVHWALGSSIVTALVWRLLRGIKSKTLQEIVARAVFELRSVVLEVHQAFVTERTKGRADGKLTDEEKAAARQAAIDKFKSYIGVRGLQVLMRILGLDAGGLDQWIGGKVDSTVAELKAGGMLPKGPVAGPPSAPLVRRKRGATSGYSPRSRTPRGTTPSGSEQG